MSARDPLRVVAPVADTEGCADGQCGPPPAEELQDCADVETAPMTACQFTGAVGSLVLALPAILGACCWPMVVAAVLNLGASVMNGGSGTGAVDFFHGLQVAIMMTLMFNLVQFVWWTCKNMRQGTFLQVHSPTLLVLLSAIMVNIQPLWILVIGSWKLCCGTCEEMGLGDVCPGGMSYPPWPNEPLVQRTCYSGGNVFWDGSYCGGKNYALFPTQVSGWIIQIGCTWGGFFLMFTGVFQATRFHKKLGAKWRAITRRTAAR